MAGWLKTYSKENRHILGFGMSFKGNNICLLIHSLQPGGMERVMSELAGYFCQKTDLEVHLVLYGKKPELFYKLPESIIIHKPASELINQIRLYSSFKRLYFLRRTVKNINPKSLLSFGEQWNSFVLLALLGFSIPVFISDRCSPLSKSSAFHLLLKKILYPRAQGIISQTEKAAQVYKFLFKNANIRVIGNPIRKIRGQETSVEKENNVLTVGRLIHSKHHDKLIELFISIAPSGWRLVIVGDDALRQNNFERLKSLVKDLDAEDRVILTGRQAEVDSYYLRSKLFVLTSSSEGFPNVIGEAMSAGLPVVSFDCVAGPSEMITDGKDGYLVPLFDYKTFGEKLLTLMNDPVLREQFGKEAKSSIDRFSVERIGEQYYSFITSSL